MSIVITVPSYYLLYDKKNLRAVLRKAGAEIAAIDRTLLRKSIGSGRRYGKHIASAIGQPPTSLSGALAASVSSKVNRDGDKVTIKEGVFYAQFLETGAKGGGRQAKGGGSARTKRGVQQTKRVLQPRPSLAIAFAQVEPTLQARIVSALNGAIEFKKGKK